MRVKELIEELKKYDPDLEVGRTTHSYFSRNIEYCSHETFRVIRKCIDNYGKSFIDIR